MDILPDARYPDREAFPYDETWREKVNDVKKELTTKEEMLQSILSEWVAMDERHDFDLLTRTLSQCPGFTDLNREIFHTFLTELC